MNKRSRKRLFITCTASLLGIIGFFPLYAYCGSYVEQFVYDLMHENKPVKTYGEAKRMLQSYPQVTYNEIPKHLRRQMHSKEIDYSGKVGELRFYVVPRKDVYKKVFLHHRIYSFICGEQRRGRKWFEAHAYYYVCIDDTLLKTAFALDATLRKRGYNNAALRIISAYRSPSHNDKVGGARNSMHLYGKAFDIRVGDINRDGRVGYADKKIVYKILDKELIRNEGGLGLYPNTMVLHMDVRGRGDRWNHYRR